MRFKSIISWGILLSVIFLAAGIASCSNPDERPTDTFFPPFVDPLAKSPVGLVITDPIFRQVEPDPLVNEQYRAAVLNPLTSTDLWNHFTGATQSIKLVCTRISNQNMVDILVGLANKGIKIDIVTEQGFFTKPDYSKFIAQLTQAGNITIKTDDDGEVRQVHSRYAIIDDHFVLASSGDFLDNSFNTSVNNTLIFNTPKTYINGSGPNGVTTITDAFLFDFDQMFNMNRFGGDKERLINHIFNIGVLVEIYFGPNDNLLAEVFDKFSNSLGGIQYAVNQITDPTMMVVAANGFGFTDNSFGWYGYNAMNHKFMLVNVPTNVTETINPVVLNILDPVVVTGSANWTHNGLNINDEQVIVVHDLTLGFQFAIEMGVLQRESAGRGIVFGTVRTHKNVPIRLAQLYCDSDPITGTIFGGDGGVKPEDILTDGRGMYWMEIPTGFLRNIQLIDLGEASGLYIFPQPLWGEDTPNAGWNLFPGSSFNADFYLYPMPSGTGTGGSGGGGFGP
jgi:hypothetical protein